MMLADAALKFIGTPYRHQGRTPGIGLDCAGVLICAMRKLGIAVNDCRTYGRVPPRNLLTDMIERHGFIQQKEVSNDGDLCLFWMRHKRLVIHCGIATNDQRELIHVEDGRKVERTPIGIWRPQLAGVYRLPRSGTW